MFSRSVINRVSVIAKQLKIEPAALLAVAEVESAGVPLWRVGSDSLPPIRFEGHYFYKRLKGDKLKQAIEQGLASPKMGGVKNPASYSARYALLGRAMKIDAEAAIESTSWGLGQVMGAHWKKLGYSSAKELMDKAKSGIEGQIEIMADYIRTFGLVDELQTKGWASFARQYNGVAYKNNRYDAKMAAAYKLYTKVLMEGAPDDPEKAVEKLGGDPVVKAYQTDLGRLGYYKGAVDGLVGAKTRAAIIAFQRDNGLVADGKVGVNTREALDVAIAALDTGQGDTSLKAGGSVAAGSGLGQFALDQANNLFPLGDYGDIFRYVILFLTVVGVGLMLYGAYKKFGKEA